LIKAFRLEDYLIIAALLTQAAAVGLLSAAAHYGLNDYENLKLDPLHNAEDLHRFVMIEKVSLISI